MMALDPRSKDIMKGPPIDPYRGTRGSNASGVGRQAGKGVDEAIASIIASLLAERQTQQVDAPNQVTRRPIPRPIPTREGRATPTAGPGL